MYVLAVIIIVSYACFSDNDLKVDVGHADELDQHYDNLTYLEEQNS